MTVAEARGLRNCDSRREGDRLVLATLDRGSVPWRMEYTWIDQNFPAEEQ